MKKLLSGILMAIGILIAATSGLCSLSFLPDIFGYCAINDNSPMVLSDFVCTGGNSSNSPLISLMLVLVIGGAPFLAGIGLCFAAWAGIRSARKEKNQDRSQ